MKPYENPLDEEEEERDRIQTLLAGKRLEFELDQKAFSLMHICL
jgi:hypothetical protein